MSIEALKARGIPIHGIAFVGDEKADTERTIAEMAGVRRLGRLPWLGRLDSAALADTFDRQFRLSDFTMDGDRR